MSKIRKYLINGILYSTVLLLSFGVITGLIPNSLFVRMIGTTSLDYFFLITSSILLGNYIAIHLYQKNTSKKCDVSAFSGGSGSILSFACPICNKILVLLLGTTVLLTYFEPYRPILGFLSIGILVAALYFKLR